MGLFWTTVLLGLYVVCIAPSNSSPIDVITRDVCIVGGGSAGTYTAVRLSDMGQSVIVIEREAVMGGHTNTYIDPATGTPWDYGVQIWHNLTLVHNYFARLNVALTPASSSSAPAGPPPVFADFRSGTPVKYTPPNATDALIAYSEQIAQYPFLNGGFDLPHPVPEDLLLTFSDFVKKYKLDDMVYTVWAYGQTLGNLLEQPTIYVIKRFGQDILKNLFENSFLTTASHDNSELYQKAKTFLGENVLLQSQVLKTTRGGEYNEVLVQTPSGQKTIRAKKLVVAIPQTIDHLTGWDLDDNERAAFSRLQGVGYWTGVLGNTGLPAGLTVTNVAANTPEDLPPLPSEFSFSPTSIENVIDLKYGGPTSLTDDQVKQEVVSSLLRLQNAGLNTTTPEFLAFQNHNPYFLHVGADEVRNGFYDQLNALQGVRNTWYTGALFVTADSSLIWNFTESLLPRIINS